MKETWYIVDCMQECSRVSGPIQKLAPGTQVAFVSKMGLFVK